MKFEVAATPSNFELRTSNSCRGFLLVEATLTAVVIAVGLVFITRGMSGSLKALATIQQYDRLLRLAESALSEIEATAQQGPVSLPLSGTFNPPDQGYLWQLTGLAPQLTPSTLTDTLQSMTLTVSRTNVSAPLIRLNTVWPNEWIVQ